MDENRLGTSTCTVQYEHTHEHTHRCIEGVGGGRGERGGRDVQLAYAGTQALFKCTLTA